MKLERTGSIWDRSNRNGINNNWDRLEGIMKSIDDLVAKGQLTPSQYASLIGELNGLIKHGQVSVYDIDKNKGLLDQSFFTPEFLKQIAGTAPILSTVADGVVTNPKVAARAISPDKTTFFNTGENLFDGKYTSGLLVRDLGTVLRPTANYDGYEGMTAVIPVEPGKSYAISVDSSESNVFRVGINSTRMAFGERPTSASLDRTVYAGDAGGDNSSASVVVKSGENFLYIYVSNDGTEPSLQVYESQIDSGYIPPPGDNEVTPEMTTFFQEGEGDNLFGGIYHDGLLFYTNHPVEGDVLYLRNNYNNFKGKTAIIPVEPNTTYAVKVHDTPTNDLFRIGLMDNYPTFVDSNQLSYTVDDFITEQRTYNKEHIFTTKNTTEYALIYVSNDGSIPRLMVNEGDEYKDYVSNIFIPAHYLQMPENTQTAAKNDGKFAFSGDFNAHYSESELENYYSNPTALTPSDYHVRFKQLIDQHSIASRTHLGDDDLDNPLYKYEIKPTQYYKGTYWNQNPGDEGTPVDLPKIIITAGVHGRERNVSYAGYYLFKSILENPDNLEVLDIIKTNMHLILIPIASPSGFIDNSYENANGMNINRDFPPYGEVTQGESKLIKQVLDENKDMDFFIDYHNMLPRHDLIGYSLTDNEFFKNMTLNMYRRVGRHWQQKESSMPQAINHRWAYTVASNEGTVGRYVNDVLGVPSALIEIPLEYQWGSEGRHGPKNTQMGVDILMNTIFACIRSKQ